MQIETREASMEYLPFFLVVGTRSAHSNDMEYRWTLLPLVKVPDRTTVFCRRDGAMDTHFLKSYFSPERTYDSVNAATNAISTEEYRLDPQYPFTLSNYTIQIEHFPDECFPL